MSLPIFDETPEMLDVPEQCKNCPALSAISADFLEAQKFQAMANALGTATLEGMPGEIREAFSTHLRQDHYHSPEESEGIINDLEINNRTFAAHLLDIAEISNSDIIDEADKVTALCQDGPLTMRAVRNGAAYTVRICTSLASSPYCARTDITRTAKS
ncbi:hypothetical protein KC968_01570 [Candidatus Saccharibacteria bacterium]|nr:hypothetical protein [Candidatus Saccharibacteria bacterium]